MRILALATALFPLVPSSLPAQTSPSSPARTPAAIAFLGGDGSSYSQAIVITAEKTLSPP